MEPKSMKKPSPDRSHLEAGTMRPENGARNPANGCWKLENGARNPENGDWKGHLEPGSGMGGGMCAETPGACAG